jgi:RimJ/RimL family protein N-acetyltransferase
MNIPVFESSRIKFRLFDEFFCDDVFRLYSDIRTRPLWSGDREFLCSFQFRDYIYRKIDRDYHTFFIAFNESNHVIGVVFSNKYDIKNGFLYTTVALRYEYMKTGLGAEAGLVYCDFLFQNYPIRKIYTTVFSYNELSKNTMYSAGFNIEGTLKQHVFVNGKYHDLNILSVFKNEFYSKHKDFLAVMKEEQL